MQILFLLFHVGHQVCFSLARQAGLVHRDGLLRGHARTQLVHKGHLRLCLLDRVLGAFVPHFLWCLALLVHALIPSFFLTRVDLRLSGSCWHLLLLVEGEVLANTHRRGLH